MSGERLPLPPCLGPLGGLIDAARTCSRFQGSIGGQYLPGIQDGHSRMIILSRWGPFCMTALSNEKNTMHYLMRLVQVLVGAVLQNGGGHPQDCQDAPAWERRSMWLGDPLEAHILSVLDDRLESLIEAVEERQPMIEVALLAKRPVSQMPAREWDMRISRHE